MRSVDRRLLDGDLHTIRFRIELNEHVALLYAIIVIDQYSQDLTWYPRRYERYIAVHVGVVGGDCVQRVKNSRYNYKNNDQATQDEQRSAQQSFS